MNDKASKVPPTRRQEILETLHGVEVADPYRWLEDVKAPDVQEWMEAQNGAARAHLDGLPGREKIAARLRELFYFDSVSAPRRRGGRLFYSRKHADREKSIVYWREGEAGEERVLLDPNGWSEDGSSSLGGYWPSWDGRYVAYSVKENNADEATMFVLETGTGRRLTDFIPGAKYAGASWTPDSGGFYYTNLPVDASIPVADRPGFAELRFHRIGTESTVDPLVYPRTGSARTFLSGGVSRSGRWLFVYISHGWNSTDVYVRDLKAAPLVDGEAAGAGFLPLVVGVEATFSVDEWQDIFYVQTNDGAPRYRVFRVKPEVMARESWEEIVPENESTLETVQIVGGRLVLSYLRQASSTMEVRTLAGELVRVVGLPGIGTTYGMVGDEDEDEAYFGFTSFTQASVIYRTSIATGAVEEWTRVSLPIDTSRMVVDQVWYPSKDGTKVSMFLIHNNDAKRDGTNPTILYGYGGFNVTMTPEFAGSRALWLEMGGVYAIPNLRGGGEYGEEWHRDGMLLKKQNTFDDFVGAARYLVGEGWTSPEHLAISGGSNGGLLVGAAMTQAPELFKAVICAVPLLDMVRYHLFGSGTTWVPEYGSPDDPEQFGVLHGYSPYHRVREGTSYPALLMLAADSDDRVDPMHARKLVAAVQHATAGEAPVLLRIERNAGHGGADLVKQAVEQTTDTFSFLLAQLR